MRKLTFLTMALLLALVLLGPATTTQAQGSGVWVGEYFNNTTLSGEPVVSRVDNAIDFNWSDGQPAPSGTVEEFSARWTAVRTFEGGQYTLNVTSDDGVRVYVDNREVLNAWYDQSAQPAVSQQVSISPGLHALVVEYYNNQGPGSIDVGLTPMNNGNASGQWTAQYFNNSELSGTPVVERTEEAVNYNWNEGSPVPGVIVNNNFSARWTSRPYFTAGTYTFTLNADDGVRFWIDGNLIIDRFQPSGFNPAYTATANLTEGPHDLRLDYYEVLDVAGISLDWERTMTPPGAPNNPPVPEPGLWQASYFNNTDLAGPAVFSQDFSSEDLALNWGQGSPAAIIASENFSARFTRTEQFNSGNVRFTVRADDGVRLYVDDQLLLNEWHVASGRPYFVDYTMTAGQHTITAEVYEGTGLARFDLNWVSTNPTNATANATASVDAFLLNVRSGPSIDYAVIDRIQRGETYGIIGRSASVPTWYALNINGVRGWVSGSWVSVSGSVFQIPVLSAAQSEAPSQDLGIPTGRRVVATSNLNIRSGPGLNFARESLLPQGQDADVVGRSADGAWWQINYAGGRGWVAATYTRSSGDLNANVPITG